MAEDDEYTDNLVNKILNDPLNLATEIELREQVSCATKAYQVADEDGTGYLTSDEIGRLCEEMGLRTDNEGEEMFIRMDVDGSDEVDLQEWLVYWLKRVSRLPNPAKQQEVIARNTFKKFDTDNSGSLDVSEFEHVIRSLGAEFTEEELAAAIDELDSDHSGRIEHQEFVDWWCNRAKKNRQSSGLIAIKLRKLARKANQIYNSDIFTAIWNNDIALVKSFVEADLRSLLASDATDYGCGWTALHYAAYQGHLSLVEYIIEHLPNTATAINKGNDHGFTSLFYAAQHGHVDVCKLLIDHDADPSIFGVDPNIVEGVETFMCPAHFCSDYTELYDLFSNHPKCIPPKSIPKSKISASFNSISSLSIELPSQKSFTSLPIHEFIMNLSCDESLSIPALTIKHRVMNPTATQAVDIVIDKKWLQRAFLTLSAADKNIKQSLMMTIEPINVMGVAGPVSDVIIVDITKSLASFRSSAQKAPSIRSTASIQSTASHKPSIAADSKISHRSEQSFK